MQVQVALKIEMAASVDLSQMELQIQAAGQQAMREAMKQAIRQWEDRRACCPRCGQQPRRLEGTVRRVIATLFGRVQVPRRRFRGLGCGQRWCPANALFAQLKGGTMSQPLQEAAALVGCSWPYRVACRARKKLSGAQLSAEEIRLQTNRQGQHRAAQQQAEAVDPALAQAQSVSAVEPTAEPMLVGLDGGWVWSREQRGGMEGKVAVVCSHLEDLPLPTHSATFSWSQRGGPRPPVFWIGLISGVRWIRRCERLDAPKNSPRTNSATSTCSLDPDSGTGSWTWPSRDYATREEGLEPEGQEKLRQTIGYLQNHRDGMGSYEQWKRQGYPVGSGMLERAVALVINRRMKKRGMRWLRPNATAVVALQTDVLNDDWIAPQQERFFPSPNPGFWSEPFAGVGKITLS